MPVATGGRMIQRTPNDPAWYKDALYHDDMRINVPGLWYTSLYDIALAPNLELYNLVRKTAKGDAANQQWLIIAPVGHCAFNGSAEQTIVGERDMGDARLNYQEIMYGFFDLTLKGTPSAVMESQAKVRYYTIGNNKWNSSDIWPPRGATPVTYYLASGGGANTLNGDGILTLSKPAATATPDKFTYDPMDPVPTLGGYRVGSDPQGRGGSFDQRKIEERKDVLVYTTEPFTEGTEVAGPITPTLYVSADVKDTDFPSRSSTSTRTAVPATSTNPSSACATATATTSPRYGWSATRSTRSRCSRSSRATTSFPATVCGSKCRAAASRDSSATSTPAAATTTRARASSRTVPFTIRPRTRHQ